MSASGLIDGAKFPIFEFGLANARIEVAVIYPAASGVPSEPANRSLTVADVGAALRLVEETAQRLDDALPGCLARRDRASRAWIRSTRWPLAPFLRWRQAALRSTAATAEANLQAMAEQRNTCRVTIRHMFGVRAIRSYLRMVAAFQALGQSRAVWSVGALPASPTPTPLSGAALTRGPARVVPCLPEFLDTGWPGLAFQRPNGSSLDVHLGMVTVRVGTQLTLASLLDSRLDYSERLVVEDAPPVADATVETRVWQHANKDGSPDRRYAGNPRRAVVRYGVLSFAGPGIEPHTYLVSDVRAAREFAAAFTRHRHLLSAAAHANGDADKQATFLAEIAALAVPGRPAVSVPSPPQAAPAHEYFVAAVLAATCAVGFLGMASADRRADDQPARYVQSQVPPPGTQDQGAARQQAVPDMPPVPAPLPLVRLPPTQSVPMPPAYSGDLVSAAPPTVQATPVVPFPVPLPVVAREQAVTRTGANVRAAPNISAAVLRTVGAGQRFAVFTRSMGWVQVGDANAWGWVHSSVLESAN